MELPRVTEILRMYTGYEHVPEQILERAAARGTKVHALCAGIAKGHWIPDGMVGEELLGYVQSFRQWSEAQVAEYLIIEKRYADEKLQYTGQVDFVIKSSDNQLYLVDLKTSARPQKTYPVQMGAYNMLLQNHDIYVKGAILVYLSKDGEFPNVNLLEDMEEESYVFLSALNCWHYFNKKRIMVDKGVDHGLRKKITMD